MRGCGCVNILKLGLSIYLFLFLSRVEVEGLFPVRLTFVDGSEISEVPSLSLHPLQTDSVVRREKMQQQTRQSSLEIHKRASNILLSLWKRDYREKSRTPDLSSSTFRSIVEKVQSSFADLPENEKQLLPRFPSSRPTKARRVVRLDRKLISSSLPVEPEPIEGHNNTSSIGSSGGETVPSLPVEGSAVPCDLDLVDLNFGGVQEACGVVENDSLKRRRCCPVLAAWLYSAHAKLALLTPAVPESFEMPVPPDDSQVCSTSLQSAFQDRNIQLSAPNASCDLIGCFCGIKLHQIESLSCPVRLRHGTSFNFTETRMFHSMEANCSDPTYNGCTNCLATLKTPIKSSLQIEAVTNRAYAVDCRMTGLLWLLATNRTLYLPTVSAVLRAMVYQSGSLNCSLDKENMPLAYDDPLPSTKSQAHSEYRLSFFVILFVPLINYYVHM